MKTIYNIQELEEHFTTARNILIVTHKNPSVDSLAASLSLYLALVHNRKNVTIACPDKTTVEFGNLFGVDKVTNVLGNKNFIISLDYKEGSIEKVSYNIEGEKFNLVIQPKEGSEPFSEEKVHYNYAGLNADLIFVIDCEKLEDLETFYTQEQEIYSKVPVVNIDTSQNNEQFGQINIVNSNASSVTELVALMLKTIKYPFDQDCATNILTGITEATDTFSKGNISSDTFEIAAFCLQMGGKLPGVKPVAISEEIPMTESIEIQKDPKPGKSKTPPKDWLEPKIFKGSSLV